VGLLPRRLGPGLLHLPCRVRLDISMCLNVGFRDPAWLHCGVSLDFAISLYEAFWNPSWPHRGVSLDFAISLYVACWDSRWLGFPGRVGLSPAHGRGLRLASLLTFVVTLPTVGANGDLLDDLKSDAPGQAVVVILVA
jgi:hypothetical protein